MMPARSLALLVCALSLTALGQQPSLTPPPPPPESPLPEAGWSTLPGQGELTSPPPPIDTLTPPPPPPSPELLGVRKAPPPLSPNQVSLYTANAVGQGHTALGLSIGFPFLEARAAYGVLPTVDLGLAFQTLYGAANDFRALARWQMLESAGWHLGLVVDGGYTVFLQPAAREVKGTRWLTGLRNWNVSPGLVVSFQGADPRATRVFAEVRYHLGFDTEPVQRNPLGGVPADVQVLQNVPVRLGAEFPLTAVTSVVFTFGLDFHGSPDDSQLMPMASLGVVTAF